MKNTKEQTTRGITLVALVVTIVILVIISSVAIAIGINGGDLFGNADKAAKAWEDASLAEQAKLDTYYNMLGVRDLTKYYADYNGPLHVQGIGLANQYNENIALNGMAIGNSNNLKVEWYNRESITTLKEWGANVLRIPMDVTDTSSRNGYVNHPELIDRVYDLVDICIDLDMYVIVDWHVLNEKNPLTYVENAKDFFTKVATRYKDYPNIIYEICNEPTTTWQDVIDYSNELIPLIRGIDSDSVILVGGFSEEVCNNASLRIQYENIMYVPHIYLLSKTGVNKIVSYIENELPVFVTEFGTTTSVDWNLPDPTEPIVFLEKYADRLLQFMERYNISWTNWSFGSGYGYPIVQRNKWQNSLDDSILNITGKYMKSYLTGERNLNSGEKIAEMMPCKQGYAFWTDEYKNTISKIVFDNTLDMNKVNNAIESWDLTSIMSDKKVYGYVEPDPNDSNMRVLHIAGDGNIHIFFSTADLFKGFLQVKEIDLTYFDTTAVNDMSYMFESCKKVENITLGDHFDTSSAYSMEFMFRNCNYLTSIDLSGFDMRVVSKTTEMFRSASSLESIDLSCFVNKRLSQMRAMFKGTNRLSTINLENFKFTNNINYEDLFLNVRNGDQFTVIVNGQTEKTFVENLLEEAGINNGYVITKDERDIEILSFAEAFANGEYDWSDLHEIAKEISGRFGLTTNKVNKLTPVVRFTYDNKLYKIQAGDLFTVTDTEGVSYTVRVLGFNTDKLASVSNTNGTYTYQGVYAGISFEFLNHLWREVDGSSNRVSIGKMNSTATNENGWGASEIRTYLNSNDGIGILTDVKDYIKTVKKEYNIGNAQATNAVTPAEDKLWILAGSEIYPSTTVTVDNAEITIWGRCRSNESTITEGINEDRYVLYKILNPRYGHAITDLIRLKTTETLETGAIKEWWLRSTGYSTGTFSVMSRLGAVLTNPRSATDQYGVVPCFCI